jgi:hypothetical protein
VAGRGEMSLSTDGVHRARPLERGGAR